jgi:hypothetical protein
MAQRREKRNTYGVMVVIPEETALKNYAELEG